MPKAKVLGIDYDNMTISEAADELIKMAQGRDSRYVVTPNPEISESCRKNAQQAQAVLKADLAVPDGIGVIMAARVCGVPLKERVGGYDLATALLPKIEEKGMRLYLLGAKPGVAQLAAEKITARNPGIKIVGIHHGYFDDDKAVIDDINGKNVDILFVALGSPRQEIWMYENRSRLSVGVMLGLGGSLDVFAGVAKRAPDFFIRLNLEWFYRLLRQPSRFIRMLKLPKYLLRAILTRIFNNKVNKSYES